ARVITGPVTQVGPPTASQSDTNVPILSFTITPGATDTLNSVVLNYTGTSAADIAQVRLYQETGPLPGTFSSLSDTQIATTTSFSGSNATLTPGSPIALTAATAVQFYAVVDLKNTAGP